MKHVGGNFQGLDATGVSRLLRGNIPSHIPDVKSCKSTVEFNHMILAV
jgi:hypothetical protein